MIHIKNRPHRFKIRLKEDHRQEATTPKSNQLQLLGKVVNRKLWIIIIKIAILINLAILLKWCMIVAITIREAKSQLIKAWSINEVLAALQTKINSLLIKLKAQHPKIKIYPVECSILGVIMGIKTIIKD